MRKSNYDVFFELVKISLGQCDRLSNTLTTEEWYELYRDATEQSVVAFVFEGVQKLPREQWPPQSLLFEWIGTSEQIKQQNKLLNKRTVEISKLFKKAGYRSCILKGQGNAMMYPNPYSRTSGDIDIWIDGNKYDIINYVKSIYSRVECSDKHIDFPVFDDVPVEVHFIPNYSTNPFYEKRLQLYFKKYSDIVFNNYIDLIDSEGKICVPNSNFNVIYQLSHIMTHFFVEGIGMRHFLDYYFVLRNSEIDFNKKNACVLFEQLGMLRFARGVMWVERRCFDLEEKYMLLEPDEKVGRIILNEMLEGGNFGQFDERYNIRRKGYFLRGIADTYRLLKLSKTFPIESLWKIFRKIQNQVH